MVDKVLWVENQSFCDCCHEVGHSKHKHDAQQVKIMYGRLHTGHVEERLETSAMILQDQSIAFIVSVFQCVEESKFDTLSQHISL
jgi:hypothetical protein